MAGPVIRDQSDEDSLVAVAQLIGARVPMDAWPPQLAEAFAVALEPAGLARAEVWKVAALRGQLFGPAVALDDPLPFPRVRAVTRALQLAAERIRGDLVRHVGLRAGAYLLADQPFTRSLVGS